MALKWRLAQACLTPAAQNYPKPFHKTKQGDNIIFNFHLTKIELFSFPSPSIGSFISRLGALQSLVRGQVVIIIILKIQKKKNHWFYVQETHVQHWNCFEFQSSYRIKELCLSGHQILKQFTYLSNSTKLLFLPVKEQLVQKDLELVQSTRQQKTKLLLNFLRKTTLCSETWLDITWSLNNHATANGITKEIVHVWTTFFI